MAEREHPDAVGRPEVVRDRRLTRRYDLKGRLVAVMCCVCFEWTRPEDLWVDEKGVKWDGCKPCATREQWK